MNSVLHETRLPSGCSLQLVQGDLSAESTDAIVNAANAYLKHGAGVAGVLLRRGGLTLQQESDAWVRQHGPVSHAAPAWTSGGALACRYVIHAVGPVWGEGEEDAKLAAAITGSLRAADGLGLASIALPAISTGVFGFPRERAARVILSAVQAYAPEQASGLGTIRLVLYDAATLAAFEEVWHDYFGA